MEGLRLARACAAQMLDDDRASRDLGMTMLIIEQGAAEVRRIGGPPWCW